MPKISTKWKLSIARQRFSLPEALVFYMAKNPPSPKLYNKLIRCCKYFWLKYPVITLNCLCRYDDYKYWITYKNYGFQEPQKFKIENLNKKLWIYQSLIIQYDHEFLASSLIPKIYRCDLSYLSLSYQILSFDEFKKFVSSGSLKWLDFMKTVVKNNDGTIVPIEKLIELLPNLRSFTYFPPEDELQAITSETAVNLNAIPHFFQIANFTLGAISESFDFVEFFSIPKVKTSMFNELPD